MLVEVAQAFFDDSVLSDERDNLHPATALGTSQRVDFIDAIEQLGPTSAYGSSRRCGRLRAG